MEKEKYDNQPLKMSFLEILVVTSEYILEVAKNNLTNCQICMNKSNGGFTNA